MDQELRSLEDVDRILGYAKLNDSEIQSTVQCLSFPEHIDSTGYKLMEIDKDILEHLQEGDRMVLRGQRLDSAVLCSKDRTYDVREAETTNSLVLVPDLLLPDQLPDDTPSSRRLIQTKVRCIKYEYYELRPIQPRLERLHALLHEHSYAGASSEQDSEVGKYTFKDLLEIIQASEEELKEALNDMLAFIIDGYWRVLETGFMDSVLHAVISVRDENAWESIPLDECTAQLEDTFPREVIRHVVTTFASPVSCDLSKDGHKLYHLNEDKICRFVAEVILQSTKKFNLSEFEKTWQLAVPDGMSTSLYQLEGLVLVDRDTQPAVIQYFPVNSLPQDLNNRFMMLFKTRPKWTLDEITPYIKDLATEKLGVSALLTKFARASTQHGVKVYSSKKPIS